MSPVEPDIRERNRALIAERLNWPDGALDVCRHLEVRHPGYSVWWGVGWVGDPTPGFYARPTGDDWRLPTFYGESAVDLDVTLAAKPASLFQWRLDPDTWKSVCVQAPGEDDQ